MAGMHQKTSRRDIGVALKAFRIVLAVVNNTYPTIVLTTLEMNGL